MNRNFFWGVCASLFFISCTNFAYANPSSNELAVPMTDTIIAPATDNTNTSNLTEKQNAAAQSTTRRLLKPTNRKVDLHAVIFDPRVIVNAPENSDELTKKELAEYRINEALHGEVATDTLTSTKGLLEDTMKMTFEKGKVEYLAPWFDYSGYFQNSWDGANYQNSQYNINFCDVGINGKFRTKDEPSSGKKTVFRLMYDVGKEIQGNTYMQSFAADNYIMRYWSRNDQIMIG